MSIVNAAFMNIPIDWSLLRSDEIIAIQSNLSYPGALGLGGARNSDLSVSQNTI